MNPTQQEQHPKPKRTPEEDLSIPAFLKRKEGTKAPAKKIEESVEVKEVVVERPVEPWQTALAAVEPPEFREYVLERIRKGIFMRRWLVIDENRHHYQNNVDEILGMFRVKYDERAARAEENAKAQSERAKKIPRLPSPTKGLIPLKKILAGLGKEAPKRKHAMNAIDEAKLEHVKYHFPDAPVTLAHVRQIITSYVPPAGGKQKVEYPKDSVITFGGKNPKKEGSDAYERWETLRKHDKKTFGEFVAAGGNPTTLRNALERGSAKLEMKDGAGSGAIQAADQSRPRKKSSGKSGSAGDGRRSGKRTGNRSVKVKRHDAGKRRSVSRNRKRR